MTMMRVMVTVKRRTVQISEILKRMTLVAIILKNSIIWNIVFTIMTVALILMA